MVRGSWADGVDDDVVAGSTRIVPLAPLLRPPVNRPVPRMKPARFDVKPVTLANGP